MSLRVVCSRLVFGEVTSPNTRTSEAYCCCKLTGRVQSLYEGDKKVTPRQQASIEGRGSSTFFQIPKPVQRQSSEPISVQAYVDVGMKIEIFPSPRAQEEARAWNFSKSQGPYKGGDHRFTASIQVYYECKQMCRHFHFFHNLSEFGIFPSPRDYMKRL